ncbi:MAG: hypothetical protein IJS97_07845 [Prevotella sp.]|nr:hypothetical protein [Prevotella sp.]
MRKFTLMLVALMVATMSFAQKAWVPQMHQKTLTPAKEVFSPSHRNVQKKITKTTPAKVGYVSKRKVASADELVGPAIIMNETWYSDPAGGGNSVNIKKSEDEDNVILIYNLVPDATEPIYAEVDFEEGTISIEPGQVLFTDDQYGYGDIVLAAIDEGADNIQPDFDAMIEGTISEDGVIVFGNWADFIKEGQYAGYYWDDAIYQSTIFPANGKMDCNIVDGTEADAVSWNVVMFQSNDTVTVYNFGDHGQPVDIILTKEGKLSIPSQLVIDIYQSEEETINDYYTYSIDWAKMSINSYTIEGEATEDDLTFGNWVMYSTSGYFMGGKLADGHIYYIDGEKFSFDFEEPEPDVPVTVPENLQTEDYFFKATDATDESAVKMPLKVGFDGNDIYVQGLCSYLPDAWVKGTLEDGIATFATGQYFGNLRNTYDLYFIGVDALTNSISDVQFEYDEEAGVFTTNNIVFISLKKEEISYVGYYVDVTIEKVTEFPATPVDPVMSGFAPYNAETGYGQIAFEIPLESVNGEDLIAGKLYYQLYTRTTEGVEAPYVFTSALYKNVTEDMTEVPYAFADNLDFADYQGLKFVYLNFATAGYKAFGVQSIYKGGDETHKSNIVWVENTELGINDIAAGAAQGVTYTDLAGRAVAQPAHGLYIKTVKMADGTKKSVKVLVK